MTTMKSDIEAKLFGVETASDIPDIRPDANYVRTSLSTTLILLFLIDCTGSMDPFLAHVKEFAKSEADKFVESLGEKGREVEKVQIGVVPYRDIYVEKEKWIEGSPLFEITAGDDQRRAFELYVDGLRAIGGGDEPESPVEALSWAIDHYDFKWDTEKARVLFFMLSDASGHHIDDSRRYSGDYYPAGIPEDMDGITAQLIEKIGAENMRCVRFFPMAPNAYPWNEFGRHFPQTQFFPSAAGNGLDEVEMSSIMELVSNSI